MQEINPVFIVYLTAQWKFLRRWGKHLARQRQEGLWRHELVNRHQPPQRGQEERDLRSSAHGEGKQGTGWSGAGLEEGGGRVVVSGHSPGWKGPRKTVWSDLSREGEPGGDYLTPCLVMALSDLQYHHHFYLHSCFGLNRLLPVQKTQSGKNDRRKKK